MSNASDEGPATNLSELAAQVKDLRAVVEQAVENYQALQRENASLTARAVRAEGAVAALRTTVQFIHDVLDDVEATSAGAVLRSIEQAARHALATP